MLMPKHKLLLVPALGLLGLAAPLHAQDDAAVLAERMRESLRATTLQLRSAQNDLATAQVQNEALTAQNERLSKQLERLGREAAAYKAATEANIENLNTQLSDSNAQAERLAASLKQWQDAYHKAASVARGKERERADTAQEVLVMEREAGQLRRQNLELYRLGTEILERYEAFGLGRAVKAREPFTGLARAQLQTLVQDYRDQLTDARATRGAIPQPEVGEHASTQLKETTSHE